MEEIEKYYLAQAGSGLAGFSGVRYQRGHGFFGRLLSGSVFPLLKFLGKNLLKTGVNVASDLIETDDFSLNNLKNTAKANVKKQAGELLESAVNKMKGSGRRRRRRKTADPLLLAKYYRAKVKARKMKKGKHGRKRIKGGRRRRKCQRKTPSSYSGEFLF